MITRGLPSFLRALSRKHKRLTAARKEQPAPKSFVPIPPPPSGMIYDEPRDAMIKNLLKDIRLHVHPPHFPYADDPCDICDTEFLRQTLEGYSDDLLQILVSYQRSGAQGNGTYLAAHEGKDEAYVRTYFFIRLSKELDRHFSEVGQKRNFLYRHAAFAVSLYETLPYEDSEDYYRKAIALTGAVLEIMRIIREGGAGVISNEVPLISYYSERLFYTARLTSDELAEYICANTDQWEQIAEVAAQRGTSDPSTIKGLLEAMTKNSTPSLHSGLL